MPQSIKSPAACSHQELENFKAMLLLSEQEGEEGLSERIGQAELLAFHYEDKQLVAIAALKKPVDGYKKGIFKKAGLLEQVENYPLEFGWTYIQNDYRSLGLGSGLLQRLLQRASGQGIFAIARSADTKMADSLLKRGFVASGEPYSRRSHRYTYQVFLRPGSAPATAEETAPDASA